MIGKDVRAWEGCELASEVERWNIPLLSWLHFDPKHEGRISQFEQAQAEFLILAKY